jgi:hypothetical protein
MKIETNSFGSHLPDKPYFPLYLSNGVDGMMINVLGSGDCWFESTTDHSAPLSTLKAPGWYKSDRRTKRDIDLVYGILFPLFEFSSCPILNGDLAVPRDSRQYFDPTTATLTTYYEQLDNETLKWMRVKVTTFLTNEHVLVEHYELEEVPASGAAVAFFLNSPAEAYIHLFPRVVKMDRATLRVNAKKSLVTYDYVFDGFQGGARSWVDCESESGSEGGNKKEVFLHGELRTRPMRKGESFTRYLVAVDSEDARNYRATLEATLKECQTLGYRRIKACHDQGWRSYFQASSVEIPDPAVSFFYHVSRYMSRANLHPSGFLPMGNLPYLWQGVMFWDAGFVIRGLTGSGNLSEARRALDHLREYQKTGRQLARRYGGKGMRMEWTAEKSKFTTYPTPTLQVHNNAWWAHTIYSFYEATDDLAFLERNFDVMGDLLVFMNDCFIEDKGDHCVVRKCAGPDESVSSQKINDTWTAALTLKALMEYEQAARILKKKPLMEGLGERIKKLEAGLAKNVDEKGVMQSFQKGKLPHWGSLIFDLFPEHPALQPTLRKMMENYDPKLKVYNFMGVNRYAAKGFPWAGYWAARCFALAGDTAAHHVLTATMESSNYFAGMPERVFNHGELFNNWFFTAHAAMVWAVNGMLASARDDVLRILGGVHHAWKDVSFENIHAGNGLVVSASVRQGKLVALKVRNLRRSARQIKVLLGDQKRATTLLLRPRPYRLK